MSVAQIDQLPACRVIRCVRLIRLTPAAHPGQQVDGDFEKFRQRLLRRRQLMQPVQRQGFQVIRVGFLSCHGTQPADKQTAQIGLQSAPTVFVDETDRSDLRPG